MTTWIYRVALYAAIAWKRKEKRHREGKQTLHDREAPLIVRPHVSNPRLDWLYEQIAQLDEIDRSLKLEPGFSGILQVGKRKFCKASVV